MPSDINFIDHEPRDLRDHERDRPDQDHRGDRHLCRRARRAADVDSGGCRAARRPDARLPRARRLPRGRAGRARARVRVGLRRGGVRRRSLATWSRPTRRRLLQPGGHRARRGHASLRERRARAAPRPAGRTRERRPSARAARRPGGGYRTGALLQSVWRARAGGDDLDPAGSRWVARSTSRSAGGCAGIRTRASRTTRAFRWLPTAYSAGTSSRAR